VVLGDSHSACTVMAMLSHLCDAFVFLCQDSCSFLLDFDIDEDLRFASHYDLHCSLFGCRN